MLERELYDVYGLDVENTAVAGRDMFIECRDSKYYIRFNDLFNTNKLADQHRMAAHLITKHEKGIMIPVNTVTGQLVSKLDGNEAVLYKLPQDERGEKGHLASRLATFHLRGEDFAPQTAMWPGSWVGWQGRWIRRLDQLENWFVKLQMEPVKTEVDEAFLLSFPYFLGISENGIQMLADLQIDFPFSVRDGRGMTVCHHKFHEPTWVTADVNHISSYKIPEDFVYDHFTRDIAEFLRAIITDDIPYQKKAEKMKTFISVYGQINPLNETDLYLILARLCFPLHYFEAAEKYYVAADDWTRTVYGRTLADIYSRSAEYESLIKLFAAEGTGGRAVSFLPGWITNKKS